MRLEVLFNEKDLITASNWPRAVLRALRRAGNESIRESRKAVGRDVRNRKTLKAGKVSRGLKAMPSRGARSVGQLEWELRASGAPVALRDYRTRQVKLGVSAQVNRGGGAKLVKSAFVATMRNGHSGVFIRRGKARLPIDELLSTRLSWAVGDLTDVFYGRVSSAIRTRFAKYLPEEIAKASKSA